MHISRLFKPERLEQMINEGFVSVQRHPTLDLRILNYTAATQYARVWNDVTLNCRGLIIDADDSIVARPFPKFFNIEEHPRSDILFSKEFMAFEKMDGSLGILYHTGGDKHYASSFAIATRGSFTSDQAIKGTEMLHRTRFLSSGRFFPEEGYTYLFEIIYPENKIVVDYGDTEALVFLCAVHNETGANVFEFGSEADWPWLRANRYEVKCHPRDIATQHVLDNAEGYVLYFPDKNVRMKAKFEEYVRLHRIVTGVSTKSVWKALMAGDSLKDELLGNVPDEFYDWIRNVEFDLVTRYKMIADKLEAEFRRIIKEVGLENNLRVGSNGGLKISHDDRKRFATAVLASNLKYNKLLFSMLDGKNVREDIWKIIEPAFAKPRSGGDDE